MSADALYVRGDPVAAEDLARRALAEAPTAGGALAGAYSTLSMCAAIRGDHKRAIEVLREGQRSMKQLGFDTFHNDAYFETLLATMEAAGGDPVAARAHANEAVRLARQAELQPRLVGALVTLARVAFRDEPDTAERAVEEAFAIAPVALGSTMVAWMLSTQAEICLANGDLPGAVAALQQVINVSGDDATMITIARSAANSVRLFAGLGEPEAAALFAGAATTGERAGLFLFLLDARTRTELGEAIEGLRSTLGAENYEAQAQRGAEMATDDLYRLLEGTLARPVTGIP